MSWPIRARLTCWYSGLVLAVLASAAMAVVAVQARTGLARLDGELRRLSLTVEAVMRNEFGEGLDLDGAAREASTEVVTPGASVIVARTDGTLVRAWGLPLPAVWRPSTADSLALASEPIRIGEDGYLAVQQHVRQGDRAYLMAVLAPTATLDRQQADLVRALALGLVVALGVAIAGGLLVAGLAMRPLTGMARQAALVSEQTLSTRLSAPNPRDELGQLASSFNALLDRLASSLQQQRQFMAEASHQLRTPVSILRTTADVTLRQPRRAEHEYREALQIADEQAIRLGRLVDGMLLLSRADAGGRAVHAEPLYLDEIVGDCVRALAVIGAERRIAVSAAGSTDVALSGDGELLRQLFTNLLDNAVRHTRPGGTVQVEIRAGSPVTVTVRDQGRGIPAAERERVFERFARAHAGGDGAGLGLPIARWIAEAHGGTLTLDATSDAGSVFLVTLPSS
jgi:signal transduction histidine kinase